MALPESRPTAPILARAVATGLGVGLIPIAPGTFGSLLGVALVVAMAPLGWPAILVGLLVIVPLGAWAAGRIEAHHGIKDPGRIVIDEVAGQWLTFLFVPLTPALLAAGFVAFRLFDIVKPFPVRTAEKLPAGSGIMADDLVAGLYANLVLQVAIRVFPA